MFPLVESFFFPLVLFAFCVSVFSFYFGLCIRCSSCFQRYISLQRKYIACVNMHEKQGYIPYCNYSTEKKMKKKKAKDAFTTRKYLERNYKSI
mmetsp:Transcript_27848/g.44310  ORF Transcript_27848/g.44310 Transcript_27848/m.44310 type:complete len:93 (-) Transcript_27848:114-392(-)